MKLKLIEATSVRVNTTFFCEDKVIYLRWMVGWADLYHLYKMGCKGHPPWDPLWHSHFVLPLRHTVWIEHNPWKTDILFDCLVSIEIICMYQEAFRLYKKNLSKRHVHVHSASGQARFQCRRFYTISLNQVPARFCFASRLHRLSPQLKYMIFIYSFVSFT